MAIGLLLSIGSLQAIVENDPLGQLTQRLTIVQKTERPAIPALTSVLAPTSGSDGEYDSDEESKNEVTPTSVPPRPLVRKKTSVPAPTSVPAQPSILAPTFGSSWDNPSGEALSGNSNASEAEEELNLDVSGTQKARANSLATDFACENKNFIAMAALPCLTKFIGSLLLPKSATASVLATAVAPAVLTFQNAVETSEFGPSAQIYKPYWQGRQSFDSAYANPDMLDPLLGNFLVHQGTLCGLVGVGSAYFATRQDSLIKSTACLLLAGISTFASYWTLQTNAAWRQSNTDTLKVKIDADLYNKLVLKNKTLEDFLAKSVRYAPNVLEEWEPILKGNDIKNITKKRDALAKEKNNRTDQSRDFASQGALDVCNAVLAATKETEDVYHRERTTRFVEYRLQKNVDALTDMQSYADTTCRLAMKPLGLN